MRTMTRAWAVAGGDAGVSRSRVSVHGVLGVEHEVEDDLLELALVAVNARKVRVEVGFDADLRGLELVLEEDDGVVQKLVEVDAR